MSSRARSLAGLLALLSLAGLAVAGCGSAPSQGLALEKTLLWQASAGAADLLLDPFASNWDIQEAPLDDHRIHLSLSMRRYYAGGAGEARELFHRRARDLVRYGDFAGYEVEAYDERIESSALGSRRAASGIIHLFGMRQPLLPAQGGNTAPPARMTPASAVKPLS